MSSSTHHADKITDIIKVLNGGVAFYQDGSDAVNSPHVKAMFDRMLEEKQQAIIDLQPFASDQSVLAEKESDWSMEIRKVYTQLICAFSADPDSLLIQQLIDVEDRILSTFDEALDITEHCECAQLLRKIRVRMLQCQDEMVSLHSATAY